MAYRLIAFMLTLTTGILAALFADKPARQVETLNGWSHSCQFRDFKQNQNHPPLPSGCFIKLDYGSDNNEIIVYCNRGLAQDETETVRNYLKAVNGPAGVNKLIAPTNLSAIKSATHGVLLRR